MTLRQAMILDKLLLRAYAVANKNSPITLRQVMIPDELLQRLSAVTNKNLPITLCQVMIPDDPLDESTLTDEEIEKTFPLEKIPYDYLCISQLIKTVTMPADGTEFVGFLWT